MGLSALGAALVMRVWRADLAVPFEYSGDATYMLMALKGILEHGWYDVNPSLGAPFGQELYDYPFLNGENLNVVAVKILGLFSTDPAVVLNLFFLLTFPLVALSAFLVLRRLRVSRETALVISVLYSLLPYHFLRGEAHLFLSAYYSVPVACLLVLAVYADERLFARRPGVRGLAALASRRTLATLTLCVLVGSAGVYYAVFALVLLASGAVLATLAGGSRRPLWTGAGVSALIVGTLLVHYSSTLAHLVTDGANPEIMRTGAETERYSLRLIQLLLPVSDHRLAPLAELNQSYEQTLAPTESSWATLGLLGSVGFVVLVAIAIASIGAPGRLVASPLLRHASAATVIAFLLATTGGLAAVVAYFVTPWLHGWNRISTFIAFFSFLAVAIGLDRLRDRLGRGGRLAWPALLGGVLLAGALDQTTDGFIRPYGAVAAEYRSDEEFVRRIERRLPAGASVFQLPHVPFPELEYVGRRLDYDSAKAYLHSDRLRWSYGAMRWRPADWASQAPELPIRVLTTAVVTSGFAGILVDRFAYTDNAQALEGELRGVLDARPDESPNGRLSFFDARRYARQLAADHPAPALASLRAVTLRPVRVVWGPEFPTAERDGLHSWRWSTEQDAELALENPSRGPRDILLSTMVATASGDPSEVRLHFPDGSEERLSVTVAGTPFERRMRLEPGRNTIQLSSNAPEAASDARTLYVRLIGTSVLEEPVFQFYAPVGLRPPG